MIRFSHQVGTTDAESESLFLDDGRKDTKFRTLPRDNIELVLFVVLLLVSLLPLWTVPYFLTADGPAHVYNASILNKWLHGQGSYFKEFFALNFSFFPNWFSHLLLVLLMQLFSPNVADKVAITACLVLFATGFRYYINSFSAKQGYFALWVFPFLWQFVMLMGFYNYMFSIGASFWLVGYCLRHPGSSWRRMILISIGYTFLYFMHLVGLFLAVGTLVLFSLHEAFQVKISLKDGRKLTRLFALLPAAWLTFRYMQGITQRPILWTAPFNSLTYNLTHLFTVQSITDRESILALIMALSVAVFLAIAVLSAGRDGSVEKTWRVPLIMFLGITAAYFFGDGEMLGGSYIFFRLESLIYLLALVFIASVPLRLSRALRLASIFTASLISVLFVANRMHSFVEASNVVSEFRSLGPLIEDKSVVLPLKYIDFPEDRKGVPIAKKVYYFAHVTEMMELDKDVIFCENFEGTVPVFPLLWQRSKNPFAKLAVGHGFEHSRPEADLKTYNNTVVPVNYVVVWGDMVPIDSTPSGKLSQTIDEDYDLIYTTPVYKIKLYRLKNSKTGPASGT